ncbi:MAG: hydrogenase maturation nickel metallochaperone HypA/HybF [Candidatus Loosdrechtia sp.]|uniref:hydrogenase maturation nickel metallochaperone HypA/HybF n=1 Tax=Candidatus Loosdrechtia sp. TaxID=3101272 RepID=UPI003A728A4E|nr:MAG: hydrogenase maturation nickel metallochaperone HypA [Candidatus Jettenia sp. AMX2]
MSITMSMMDIVKYHMVENGVKQLKKLKIRIGKLTAIEPESLIFCFEVYTRNTSMEGAILEIENTPLIGRCNNCRKEFYREEYFSNCPVCNSEVVENISGRELDIISIEAE